jgi:hypothetical protein
MPELIPTRQMFHDQLFSIKLLIENRREFNFKTRLSFLNYMKAFDKVTRNKLFEVLQSKNFSNLLLKNILEIYSGNKIKVKKTFIRNTYN